MTRRETAAREVVTSKGEQTRAAILAAALELFREHGYEATTMRTIADRAGVSLGNSYYYFPSKEHLVQAFYASLHESTLAGAQPVLAAQRRLDRRLQGVMRAMLESVAPYHQFAGMLFRSAADPTSPLNPFSEQSRAVRNESIALFAEVVVGSSARVPDDVASELPQLLWLYHMGVILFWVHDSSPDQRRTGMLIDETSALIVRLLTLSNLPPLRSTRRRIMAFVRSMITDMAGPQTARK